MSNKPFLSERERSGFDAARRNLQRLGAGATLEDILASMKRTVPLRGCFVESYLEARPWEATHTSAGIPLR
jgi:hypothetical protein